MNAPEDEILQDLLWREDELVMLKILAHSSKEKKIQHNVLLKSLLLMLYAHYEGFCKFAWEQYLSVISNQNILRLHLHDSIICFSLEDEFRKIKNLSSDKIYNFFITTLPILMNEKVNFNIKLEAESNLKSNIFEKNSNKINITVPSFQESHRIINRLVFIRNQIAHGEQNYINDLTEYQKFEKTTIEVMYNLAEVIIDAINEKKYLKPDNQLL